MRNNLKNAPKVLGLDISTKTIGWSLFDIQTQKLLELTHVSPVIKPKPEDKIEELLGKVDAFEEKLRDYKDIGVTKVIIEEPLLNSNNVWTVGVLLRYNSMITKSIYDILGIVPSYISTYNSRKFAWPELVQENNKGKKVLFGGMPKDIDKKAVVWQKVSESEPQIVWLYTRNNTLKKECFDQADAYTCVQGYMKQQGLW
jgi:hypothetical protein|tara:strand:- start:4195 stop:4794 length:600 start_codon:yes stop_codon:yes gene_type:complete